MATRSSSRPVMATRSSSRPAGRPATLEVKFHFQRFLEVIGSLPASVGRPNWKGVYNMTDLEREWVELTTGVYIHRWQPRLLIVRRQIFHALSLPDDLSPCEWDDVCVSNLVHGSSLVGRGSQRWYSLARC